VLTSIDTPLASGPLTPSQASWVGAFLCVGGLSGTVIFGWLSNMLSRKFLLLLLAVPEAISWLLIIVSTDAGHFFASRFFSGMGGGGLFILIPIFVNEISVDRVRGSLGSLLVFTCNFGILFGYVAGYFFDYVTSAWLFLPLPVIFFVGFLFFPETPVYLLKRNKITVR
jgi:MFS family permease